jgi:hypothetical protein
MKLTQKHRQSSNSTNTSLETLTKIASRQMYGATVDRRLPRYTECFRIFGRDLM